MKLNISYNDCLCFKARKFACKIIRDYDHALRPLNINSQQLSILLISQESNIIKNFSVLSAELGVHRSTLTRALNILKKNGLVKIMAFRDDKRAHCYFLTDEGEATLEAAIPLWKKAQGELKFRMRGTKQENMWQNFDESIYKDWEHKE